MAHDVLHDSIAKQTGRASMLIVGILLGGVLVLCSYAASIPAVSQTLFAGNRLYSDMVSTTGGPSQAARCLAPRRVCRYRLGRSAIWRSASATCATSAGVVNAPKLSRHVPPGCVPMVW